MGPNERVANETNVMLEDVSLKEEGSSARLHVEGLAA